MIVSKSEPAVAKVAWPVAGAVHVYQTEAPPMFPAGFGSPASFVASTFEPVTLPVGPLRTCALAKLSLAGAAADAAVVAIPTTTRIPAVSSAILESPLRNICRLPQMGVPLMKGRTQP